MEKIEIKRKLVEEALDQLKAAQQDCYVESTQNIIDEMELALRQSLVSGRSELLFCECERNNPYTGAKFDFTLRCFDCNKIIKQNNCH